MYHKHNSYHYSNHLNPFLSLVFFMIVSLYVIIFFNFILAWSKSFDFSFHFILFWSKLLMYQFYQQINSIRYHEDVSSIRLSTSRSNPRPLWNYRWDPRPGFVKLKRCMVLVEQQSKMFDWGRRVEEVWTYTHRGMKCDVVLWKRRMLAFVPHNP